MLPRVKDGSLEVGDLIIAALVLLMVHVTFYIITTRLFSGWLMDYFNWLLGLGAIAIPFVMLTGLNV